MKARSGRPKANWTNVAGAVVSEKARPKRIAPRSKAMARKMGKYWTAAEVFKREHRHCERAGCAKLTADIHHQRGRVGTLLLDTRFWIAVCRSCHDWIAANPAQARAEGLLCAEGLWNVPAR